MRPSDAPPAAAAGPDHEPTTGAPFAPTLALTVTLALGGFALLMPLVMLIVQPEPIPELHLSQRQDAETILYLAGFGVLLPLALVAGPRLATTVSAGANGAGLGALAGLLATGLAAAVVLVRLSDEAFSWGGQMGVLATAAGLWAIAAALAIRRATRDRPWPALVRIGENTTLIWGAAAAAVLGMLLAVTRVGSLSALVLVIGAVAISAVTWWFLEERRLPHLGGRWGLAVDLAILGVLALIVVDVVTVSPGDPDASFLERYRYSVSQFHQDFFVRPANQVLGGDVMLVDISSQYGVGSIYFVAAWFKLVSAGYGTFGLLDGVVNALYFGAAYALLRIAGASRVLAASALTVGVIALVLNHSYPVGALIQEGPLRFGFPLAVILAAVAGARWPDRERALQAAALAVLALSSIWALEGFAYTAATFAALACFVAHLRPPGTRWRWLGRQVALATAVCVGAHVLLAIATLVASGELPDWGMYLAYLNAFLLGSLGDLTYDVVRWSPALAVAAGYLVSAAALVLVVRLKPRVVEHERVALIAIAGTTAYGIFLFSYFVDRSGEHVLAYISLPALLAATLWLSLVPRWRPSVPRRAIAAGLAFALSVAVLMVAAAWSTVEDRFGHTALAHVIPGGDSPGEARERLRDFPPHTSSAPIGEHLLARYMPGQRHSLVIVNPSYATETLVRSDRVNRLPLANLAAWDDGDVARQLVPPLRDAIRELRPGQRMLVDKPALAALARAKADPARDPLTDPGPIMAPLQVYALLEIDKRSALRPISRQTEGLVVVELARRP